MSLAGDREGAANVCDSANQGDGIEQPVLKRELPGIAKKSR